MKQIDHLLTGLIYFHACYPDQTKKVAYLASFTAVSCLYCQHQYSFIQINKQITGVQHPNNCILLTKTNKRT